MEQWTGSKLGKAMTPMHQTHSDRLENHLPVFIQVVHSSEVPYHKEGAGILES